MVYLCDNCMCETTTPCHITDDHWLWDPATLEWVTGPPVDFWFCSLGCAVSWINDTNEFDLH